jgi:PhnB protein
MTTQNIPPLIPMIQVTDPEATIAWFKKLGFDVAGEVMRMPDGSIGHAEVSRGPLRFMLGPAMGEVGSPGLSLYVNLSESVDRYYDSVKGSGVTITQELQDQFWGDRHGQLTDPFGHRWRLAQHLRDVPSEEIARAAAAAFGGT